MKAITSKLLKNDVGYLGDFFSPAILPSAALKVAAAWFSQKNFVPGFPDMLCVTSKKNVVKVRKLYKALKKPKFGLVVCCPQTLPRPVNIDLVWIDDANLLEEQVKKLRIKYSLLPILYSSKKSAKKTLSIVVDTREQKPMWKPPEAKKIKLEVGDYTTEKLFGHFHIERKSLIDLYGSLIQGHVRFRNEMLYAAALETKLAVYVEGTKKDFITKRFPMGDKLKSSSETLRKIVETVEERYKLEVVWCASRARMREDIIKRFKKEEKRFGI